jgi:hypothetical protein
MVLLGVEPDGMHTKSRRRQNVRFQRIPHHGHFTDINADGIRHLQPESGGILFDAEVLGCKYMRNKSKQAAPLKSTFHQRRRRKFRIGRNAKREATVQLLESLLRTRNDMNFRPLGHWHVIRSVIKHQRVAPVEADCTNRKCFHGKCLALGCQADDGRWAELKGRCRPSACGRILPYAHPRQRAHTGCTVFSKADLRCGLEVLP